MIKKEGIVRNETRMIVENENRDNDNKEGKENNDSNKEGCALIMMKIRTITEKWMSLCK